MIRQATKHDIPQLAQLRWDFQQEEEEEQPALSEPAFYKICSDFLQAGLDSGDWAYWIAERDHSIVSHAFVNVIRMIPKPVRVDDRYGYLTNTYTRPAYRNQGIGTQLLNRIKEWAIEQDLEVLIVWPSEESIPFYERAGFSTLNEIMEFKVRDQ